MRSDAMRHGLKQGILLECSPGRHAIQMGELKQKIIKGTYWVFLEQFGTQFVGFTMGIVLARLLTPTDYGTVAMISIFTAVSNVLVESGFGGALVQKKNSDDLDFNSVFYAQLALAAFFYILLFAFSRRIAGFYKVPELAMILRVSALSLFTHALSAVQLAELKKKMLFHLSFRISLIGVFVHMLVGVTLAYFGYGPWALVWSNAAARVSTAIARWRFIAWHPKLMFSFNSLKGLFSYGGKITASSLISQGYSKLYGLMVGKIYSRADLAYVNKGYHIPHLVMDIVNGSLGRVAFPALVQMQNDRARLRDGMRRMMQCSTFVVFPLMTIAAVTAPSSIILTYGDQWGESVKFMQIACFSCAIWPFHTVNLQALQAMGKSNVFLNLEIIKKVISLACLFAFLHRGLFFYSLLFAFTMGPLSVIINSWPNKKLLNYTIGAQIRDVIQPLYYCIPMGIAMYLVGKLPFFDIIPQFKFRVDLLLRICVQTLVGITIFVAIAFRMKPLPLLEYAKIAEKLYGNSRFLKKNRTISRALDYLLR